MVAKFFSLPISQNYNKFQLKSVTIFLAMRGEIVDNTKHLQKNLILCFLPNPIVYWQTQKETFNLDKSVLELINYE